MRSGFGDALLKLIMRRQHRGSTILTTNLPAGYQAKMLGDTVPVTALPDQ